MQMAFSRRSHVTNALLLAIAMASIVGAALVFEHIGGFIPCKLCLEQRTPYYIGVPTALLGAAAGWLKWPHYITRSGFVIIALLMAYGFVLGIYHSGVEWAFWNGPADCGTSATSGITTNADDLLGAIDKQTPPSCDKAAGRFLGLSFAGWNVLASLMLLFFAIRASLTVLKPQGSSSTSQ